jgi:hypothetical protein
MRREAGVPDSVHTHVISPGVIGFSRESAAGVGEHSVDSIAVRVEEHHHRPGAPGARPFLAHYASHDLRREGRREGQQARHEQQWSTHA